MTSIPVVFIHRGSHTYLQRAIHQAKRMGNTVILIGDHRFEGLDEFHPIQTYASELAAVQSFYVHKSTNSTEFEIFCIARWFVLAAFMVRTGRSIVYASDSDVFLYFRTDDIYPTYASSEALYTCMYDQDPCRWSASACCSFWTRATALAFVSFVRETYTTNLATLEEKERYHRDTNTPGGICDMTLLYLFSRTRSFTPLNKVLNGCAFDQNLRDNDNYYKDEYTKTDIQWRSGLPYLWNKRSNEWVRFYTLVEYAKMVR